MRLWMDWEQIGIGHLLSRIRRMIMYGLYIFLTAMRVNVRRTLQMYMCWLPGQFKEAAYGF